MSEYLVNHDYVLKHLQKEINEALVEAAEPVIKKAMADVETALRKRLGSIVVGLIDASFSVERYGSELRIIVQHNRT